jgi:hypothetical protein
MDTNMSDIQLNGLEGDIYDGDTYLGHYTFRGE